MNISLGQSFVFPIIFTFLLLYLLRQNKKGVFIPWNNDEITRESDPITFDESIRDHISTLKILIAISALSPVAIIFEQNILGIAFFMYGMSFFCFSIVRMGFQSGYIKLGSIQKAKKDEFPILFYFLASVLGFVCTMTLFFGLLASIPALLLLITTSYPLLIAPLHGLLR